MDFSHKKNISRWNSEKHKRQNLISAMLCVEKQANQAWHKSN